MNVIDKTINHIKRYINNGTVLTFYKNQVYNLNINENEYNLEKNGKIYDEYEGIFFCGKTECNDKNLHSSFKLYKEKLKNNSFIIVRMQAINYDYDSSRIDKFFKNNDINKIKSYEIIENEEDYNSLFSCGRMHMQLLSDGADFEEYSDNIMKSGCGGCSGCGKGNKSCCSKGGDCSKGCCNKN